MVSAWRFAEAKGQATNKYPHALCIAMAKLERKRKVQKRYDRWSRYYDSIDTLPGVSRGEMRARDKAASLVPRDGVVIDVGCGSGLMLPMLSQHTRAYIIGVDFSAKMVSIARERIKANGVNGDAIIADTDHLPFEDNSIDGAIATFALTSIPDSAELPGRFTVFSGRAGGLLSLIWGHQGANLHTSIFIPLPR